MTLTKGGSNHVATFGSELARRRATAGVSQRALGAALAEHGGVSVSGSAVGEWERDVSSPNRSNALALERALGLDPGALAELLGYSVEEQTVHERLTNLERRFDEIEAALRTLRSRRR